MCPLLEATWPSGFRPIARAIRRLADGDSQMLAWFEAPGSIVASPLSFGARLPMSAPSVLTEGIGPYCTCNTWIPLPAQETESLPSGVLPGGWLRAMWPAKVVKGACPPCACR